MLGEMIGESHGGRGLRRVLSRPGGFEIEVSFEDSGKIYGHDFNQFVTYHAEPRPDGSLYGEGAGVLQLQNGETATWKGGGVGVAKPDGAVSYRGAVYYTTTSATLAALNTVATLFEFEMDAAGNTHTKNWEWK